MTPYEIDILLHYYSRAEDHEDIHRKPPIWQPTLRRFLDDELLQPTANGADVIYAISERGTAYVEALQRIPLPVQIWVIPEG